MLKSVSGKLFATALGCALCLAPAQSGVAQDATATAPQFVFSEEEDLFILGTAIDVMFHEGGHLVIDVFDLPILGQEEDAADNFGTLALLSMEDEFASTALMQGISGWYLLSAYSEIGELEFFGRHDLGVQRASRKVCHLISAEPETFGVLGQELNLDEESTSDCGAQFRETLTHWGTALQSRNALGESQFDVYYEYRETTEALAPYRAVLEDNKMLEYVATYMSTQLALPREITLVAETCGTANAFYDPSNSTMTFCYEFAELLHDFYRRSEAEDTAG